MLVKSAVKRNNQIITGKRHSECIKEAIIQHEWFIPVYSHEQGFVDENGNFFNRQEALEIAIKSGQIPKDFNKVLTSEDLW